MAARCQSGPHRVRQAGDQLPFAGARFSSGVAATTPTSLQCSGVNGKGSSQARSTQFKYRQVSRFARPPPIDMRGGGVESLSVVTVQINPESAWLEAALAADSSLEIGAYRGRNDAQRRGGKSPRSRVLEAGRLPKPVFRRG